MKLNLRKLTLVLPHGVVANSVSHAVTFERNFNYFFDEAQNNNADKCATLRVIAVMNQDYRG